MKKILLLVFVAITHGCFAQNQILQYTTGSSGVSGATGSVIYQDGSTPPNIGIGNTGPSGALDVTGVMGSTGVTGVIIQADYTAGTGTAPNYFNAQRIGVSTPDFQINSVGQIGIGTHAIAGVDLLVSDNEWPSGSFGSSGHVLMALDESSNALFLGLNVGNATNSSGCFIVNSNSAAPYPDLDFMPALVVEDINPILDNPSPDFYVTGEGLVGFSTNAPVGQVDINAKPYLTCIGSNPGGPPSLDYIFDVGNHNSIGGLDPITTAGYYFSIHDFGYIGIGQLNSGASLVEVSDVNSIGGTGVPLLLVDNGTPADPYFIVRASSSGINVGIGVDAITSSSTLAVQGQGGTILSVFNGVGAGVGALVFADETGLYNHEVINSSATTLKVWPDIGALDVTAGTLEVYGNGLIDNNEHVVGNEQVDGNATVNGNAHVEGNLQLDGNGQVNGTVTIGTVSAPSGYNLYVQNGILTERVKVAVHTTGDWSDYVFNKDYKMMDLGDLNSYIQKNKHLPDILSASEAVKSGIDLGQMDAKLLAKVEELTLYIIKQQQELDALKKQIKAK